jgi:hypothetical protein
MKRREFLQRLATLASAGAALATGVSGLAEANVECNDGPLGPYGPPGRVCVSGLPSSIIHVEARQEQSQWCWAACISMVFAYHGHPVTQSRIVDEAYGGPLNLPAQPWTMLGSLNRQWTDDHGNHFQSRSSPGSSNALEAAQDLADNMPLIVGTMGHAVVMTAIEYAAPYVMTPFGPQTGQVVITSATVRDPWPGRGRRVLTPAEWYSINFAVQIRVIG